MSEIKAEQNSTTKKGNPSWNPAKLLDVKNKDPNYTYYWSKNDAQMIADRQEMGWEVVKTGTKVGTKVGKSDGIDAGESLDTTVTRKGMVLMRLPKPLAKARTDYYQAQNDQLVNDMFEDAKRQMREKGIDAYSRVKVE